MITRGRSVLQRYSEPFGPLCGRSGVENELKYSRLFAPQRSARVPAAGPLRRFCHRLLDQAALLGSKKKQADACVEGEGKETLPQRASRQVFVRNITELRFVSACCTALFLSVFKSQLAIKAEEAYEGYITRP